MSKWLSETFDLESKAQLKEHRKHKWKVLLAENNLDMIFHPFWSAAEIALEITLWEDADANSVYGYEKRKEVLRRQLAALDVNELAVYFQEIGVPESSVEDYLPESPV